MAQITRSEQCHYGTKCDKELLASICSLCHSRDGCIRTPHVTGSSPHLTTHETWEKARREGAREERGLVNVRDMLFILSPAQIQRHRCTGAHVKWEIKGHFLEWIACFYPMDAWRKEVLNSVNMNLGESCKTPALQVHMGWWNISTLFKSTAALLSTNHHKAQLQLWRTEWGSSQNTWIITADSREESKFFFLKNKMHLHCKNVFSFWVCFANKNTYLKHLREQLFDKQNSGLFLDHISVNYLEYLHPIVIFPPF